MFSNKKFNLFLIKNINIVMKQIFDWLENFLKHLKNITSIF